MHLRDNQAVFDQNVSKRCVQRLETLAIAGLAQDLKSDAGQIAWILAEIIQ